jgi:salicylate hydroxylase
LVHYWVSAGREPNFVAPVPKEIWIEESWALEREVGDLLDALPEFAEPARRIAGGTETLMRSALYDRDPLTTWGEGRVTLIGDACQPGCRSWRGHGDRGRGRARPCLEWVDRDGIEALRRGAPAADGRGAGWIAGQRFRRGTSSGLSSDEVYG